MRILQVNHSHYIRGGADVVYFNTATLLQEKGHDVAYFSKRHLKNGDEFENDFFVRYIDFHNSSFLNKIFSAPKYLYNREAYRNVIKLIKDFKPDIAHVHLFYGSLTISILKAMKEMKVPVVHSVHDYRLLCPVYSFLDNNNQVCEACKNHKFYSCLLKRCSDGNFFQSAIVTAEAYFWKYAYQPVSLIDHFIFVSRFIMDKHIEFNQSFASKSSHLYNFQNLNRSLDSTTIGKGNYMVYFGRLSREKGILNMLETFSSLDLKLVIAGKGPLEEVVQQYAKEHKNIKYVGFRREEELYDLIQSASYTIVPSEWYENNPMTIVESFTLGKPVIGAKIGGIPELIQNDVNGFLFEYGNQKSFRKTLIKAAGLSEGSYIKMAKMAQKFALDNFDRSRHYKSLMKIYETTIRNYSSQENHQPNNPIIALTQERGTCL